MYYTGVGSRDISVDESTLIMDIARYLADQGITLRSGGAGGSDSSFEEGSLLSNNPDLREIYTPWRSFRCPRVGNVYHTLEEYPSPNYKISLSVARDIHPYWDKMSNGGRLLHQRNIHQVMGKDLTNPEKSKFLLACSDSDKAGVPRGGTRTAWVLAARNDIPCFNIRDKTKAEVENFLDSIGVMGGNL